MPSLQATRQYHSEDHAAATLQAFFPGLVDALMAEQPADPVSFLRAHLDSLSMASGHAPPDPRKKLHHHRSAPSTAGSGGPVDATEMSLLRAEVDTLRRENERLRTAVPAVGDEALEEARVAALTCCSWNGIRIALRTVATCTASPTCVEC